MKNILKLNILLFVGFLMSGCSSTKVLDAWKSPDAEKAKQKKILVIARTENDDARRAFERDIADALISRGFDATASFSFFPPLLKPEELTEERIARIINTLKTEGYKVVVLTSVKDVRERKTTSGNNYYFNDPWNTYYPTYYGGFYGYYYQPYVYNVNINLSGPPTTYTSKTFYLETVAYDLEAEENNQLLAIVTTTIEDPKNPFKAAEKFTEEVLKAFDK